MNEDINFEIGTTSFRQAKLFVPTAYQHFIQYKPLYRRIVNDKLSYKVGLSENDKCLFCKNMVETIEHICIACNKNTRKLWYDTED